MGWETYASRNFFFRDNTPALNLRVSQLRIENGYREGLLYPKSLKWEVRLWQFVSRKQGFEV